MREAEEQYDDIDGVPSPAERRHVIGHEAARRDLAHAAASGRLHHAWLMQGPRGVGKASVAFDFARRLLSGSFQIGADAPFSEQVARQIGQGGHPNLVHIARPPAERGGGFRQQITVDGVRRLNHFFQTTAGGQWRVAIIDPAEDMNRNAANALLKILEEPPERCVFLLVNHAPGRLLATIRSRCRVLRFDPLGEREIAEGLAKDVPDASRESRESAAARADGSLRTAILMLLGGGLEVNSELKRLFGATPDWSGIQKLADALSQKGREAALDLATQDLFRLLADQADARLQKGDLGGAAAMAELWQDEQARWREASAFNLDRKQMFLTFFARLAQTRALVDRRED